MTDKRYARVILAAAVSILVGLVVAGCSTPTSTTPGGSGTTGGGGGTTIVEKNFQFSPADLTVKVGDVVTFDNQDGTAHHVFVGTTDLGNQDPGKSVTWTADKDGTFAVKCSIHPSMVGQITVGAGGTTQPAPSTAPSDGSGY